MHISRLFYIAFILVSSHVTAQMKPADAVNEFVNYAPFAGGSFSIFAIDLSSQEVVMEYDANRLLNPASTTKMFSTAMALEVLGGDYRPTTSLYINGRIEDSVLIGDLWVIGGGDMSLGSKYFNAPAQQTQFLNEWVSTIQSKGIKRIQGNIYVDGSDFGYQGTPDDWLWADLGNFYGTHFSGAMVYDNLLQYHFKTGAAGTPVQLIYTVPEIADLTFVNNIVASTKAGDNSYIFGAANIPLREGRGTLPQYQADFMVKGSLPDGELQLAVELSNALMKSGIFQIGKALSTRSEIDLKRPSATWTKILDHKGKTLREIAQQTNYESINVFAEGLMRLTGFVKTKNGDHDSASTFFQNYWRERLKAPNLYLNDGSGLARTNAISARIMTELLIYMNTSKAKDDFYNSLPIAGISGTLKNVAKNQVAHGRVHAKSGTMRRTKSYSGYVETKSGRRIAFSFMINNFSSNSAELKAKMELLMNSLANL